MIVILSQEEFKRIKFYTVDAQRHSYASLVVSDDGDIEIISSRAYNRGPITTPQFKRLLQDHNKFYKGDK